MLVEGAKKGAIYNLQSGKVHSVNSGALALLKACSNNPLSSVLDINDEQNRPFREFLEKLTCMNLGSLHFSQPSGSPEILRQLEDPQLEFVWLELTSCCNNRCLHCYATSAPDASAVSLPHERWLTLVTEARKAGAKAIQLIGGEPMLYPGWRELILKARAEDYSFIEIFTNATYIDDSSIDFFKTNNVQVATTIYADNAAIHDAVTQNPGSFARTYAAVQKVLDAGIPLRIASILMKANEHATEGILRLYEKLGLPADPPDIIRPTGRGDDKDLLPENTVKPTVKPPFYCDAEAIRKARQAHGCLAGKIAILPSGDVIPCIFSRSQVCGNVRETPLADVLNGQRLHTCWHTTKDQVEKCCDCEYRYACPDCRPLAQGNDPAKNWLACPQECRYNPYTGIWEE